MAVAHDATTESPTGTTPNTSSASFNWSHAPVGTPAGILVYTFVLNSSTETATAVDWGGVSLSAVSGGTAADTATEPGRCTAWFNGDGSALAGRANDTITVTRTNNANEMYAVAATVTAGTEDTEVHTAGIQLVENNATWTERSVTDGSPGTNSQRYSGTFFGVSAAPGAGANSTAMNSMVVSSTRGGAAVRETTPGQGSRSVGFSSGTSDDHAEVALAIKEKAAATATFFPVLVGV